MISSSKDPVRPLLKSCLLANNGGGADDSVGMTRSLGMVRVVVVALLLWVLGLDSIWVGEP